MVINVLFCLEKSQMKEFATKAPVNSKKDLRKFFEGVARKRNMDPLLAETWYNISPGEVHRMVGSFSFFHSSFIIIIFLTFLVVRKARV